PPGGLGSSTTATRSPYTCSARSRKSPRVRGTIMGERVDHAREGRNWPRPGAVGDFCSAGEALLDLLDPDLQRRHVPLQLGEVPLEDLPPPALVGESRLDAPQRLSDRLIFLLHTLQ